MATPYCDFTHFQYSFSAEGACQKFKKWRARLFSRLRNFAGGNASEKLKKNLHCLAVRTEIRTGNFFILPNDLIKDSIKDIIREFIKDVVQYLTKDLIKVFVNGFIKDFI